MCDVGQVFLNIVSFQALFDNNAEAFPGELFDDRQQAQSPTINHSPTIKQGI